MSVFSLHPGVVQSDLWRHQHQCIQMAVKIFRIFTKTTVEGAQTTIYCAVEPHLESQSGGYFRYKQHFNPRIVIKEFLGHRLHAAKYFLLRKGQLFVVAGGQLFLLLSTYKKYNAPFCNGNSLSLCVLSDCAPATCSRAASDDDLAQKLWEISCNMLGITWQ